MIKRNDRCLPVLLDRQAAKEKKIAEEQAKKAAAAKAAKIEALKKNIVALGEQKGDLIVKGAKDSQINAVDAKMLEAKNELKALQKK